MTYTISDLRHVTRTEEEKKPAFKELEWPRLSYENYSALE
jgi:hypothetical protein